MMKSVKIPNVFIAYFIGSACKGHKVSVETHKHQSTPKIGDGVIYTNLKGQMFAGVLEYNGNSYVSDNGSDVTQWITKNVRRIWPGSSEI